MNSSISQPLPEATDEPDFSPLMLPPDSRIENRNLDQTLGDIRSGRRLKKVVASVEGFLNGQVARLNQALDECQRAASNDAIVQRILADFEREKHNWEEKRQSEIARLKEAGDKLSAGWKVLEDERRRFLDQRNA